MVYAKPWKMLAGHHLALARELGSNSLTALLSMSVGRNFSSSGKTEEQKEQGSPCQGPALMHAFWLDGQEEARTSGMGGINS